MRLKVARIVTCVTLAVHLAAFVQRSAHDMPLSRGNVGIGIDRLLKAPPRRRNVPHIKSRKANTNMPCFLATQGQEAGQ